MKKILKIASVIIMLAVMCSVLAVSSSAASAGKWISAWGTGPTNVSLGENISFMGENLTARTVITTSASGSKIRIKFTNYYGTSEEGLKLENVTVAKSVNTKTVNPDEITSAIDLSTLKQVTFNNGSPMVTIPMGGEIYSDPISLPVEALDNIAISFFCQDPVEIRTMGLSSGVTFLSINGDKTHDESFNFIKDIIEEEDAFKLLSTILPELDILSQGRLKYKLISVVPCVSTVDVYSDEDAYSVAVVGDSTVANEFPLYLAQEISNMGVKNIGVVGKGILGNMLCSEETSVIKNLYGEPLVDRFDKDVKSLKGVKYVIVKIGANDIIHPVSGDNLGVAKQPTSNDIIRGLKAVCDKIHNMGAKVILSTITQWKGTTRDYFGTGATYVRTSAELEADWQIAVAVNKWITSSTNTYHDGFVDLTKMSGYAAGNSLHGFFYDKYSEDGIHPNDDLQKKWASSFPMGLLGVSNKVGNIFISASEKTLYSNGTDDKSFTLKVKKVLPDEAENKAVKLSTNNSDVVSLKVAGDKVYVTAKKNGTATITCKATDGSGVTASCKVTVKSHVESVKLNATSASVYTRKSMKLKATVLPSNAADKSVTWKSLNTRVATVDSNGLVSAVGAGKAKIVCTTKDGSKTATCLVTVTSPVDVTMISLNVSAKTLDKWSKYQLKATVIHSNATFKDVSWKSSDTSVATVDKNGLVKALKTGTTYITCVSKDNPMIMSRAKITVVIKVTGVEISKTSLVIYQAETKTLKGNVVPSYATNKKVKWGSTNKSVATVDQKGVVKAIASGTANIVIKSIDGEFRKVCKVTVKKVIKVKKVSFEKDNYNLSDGKTLTLKPVITPSNASVKDVKWTSSNTKIAKVNAKGVVTAIKPGKVTITCTSVEGGKTGKCTVTVKKVNPSSVSLNSKSLTLVIGKSATLKATVMPSNTTDKSVKWTSSNPNVATVNSKGVVTAKLAGKATITCTTTSGQKVAKCVVTVPQLKITKITLNKSSATVAYLGTLKLTPKFTPSNASNKSVKWSSSNTKVATVDKNGVVKGVGTGTATITCKAADGGSAPAVTCKVTVKKQDVLGIRLDCSSLLMDVTTTYQLRGKIVPENASDKRVMWKTSDVNVASVSSTGLVTARGKGTCVIKAIAIDGGYVAACTVTVR